MNNEIKEILDFLKDKDDYIEEYGYEYKRISLEDTKILLDYITNLQDYKSRCEKAIEYIEKSMDNSQPFYKYLFGDENGKVENLDRLLNILQGVGKDE